MFKSILALDIGSLVFRRVVLVILKLFEVVMMEEIGVLCKYFVSL